MRSLRNTLMIALALSIALAVPLSAQDFSDEELDLIERVSLVVGLPPTLDSFTAISETEDDLVLIVFAPDDAGVLAENKQIRMENSNAQLIRSDDGVNAVNMISVEVSESDGNNTFSYALEGEVRIVDGTIYATATYTEGEGPEILPPGWTIVPPADTDVTGAYDDLEIDNFIEFLEGRENNPLADLEQLQSFTLSVVSEEGEYEGAPAEVITLILDPQPTYQALAAADPEFDSSNPLLVALLDMMTDESNLELSVTYNEAGEPVIRESNIFIVADGIDAAPFGFPEGSTVRLELGQVDISELQDVNSTELVPVEAPE